MTPDIIAIFSLIYLYKLRGKQETKQLIFFFKENQETTNKYTT